LGDIIFPIGTKVVRSNGMVRCYLAKHPHPEPSYAVRCLPGCAFASRRRAEGSRYSEWRVTGALDPDRSLEALRTCSLERGLLDNWPSMSFRQGRLLLTVLGGRAEFEPELIPRPDARRGNTRRNCTVLQCKLPHHFEA
jgi:hypothetical protein